MTKDNIVEIESYCSSHNISKGSRLSELVISPNVFYHYRRKHLLSPCSTKKKQEPRTVGSFIPLNFPNDSSSNKGWNSRKKDYEVTKGNNLIIEMRTLSGIEIRIQGQINVRMLREIIHSSSDVDNV